MRASWAVLERREAETARRHKSVKNLRKMNDFGLVGLSWAASWRPLGVSWRPLGPSWAHLGRLGPIFRRLEAFLDHLADHLGAVRAARKRVCRNGAVFRRLPPAFPPWLGRGPGGSPPRPPQGNTKREPLRKVGEKVSRGIQAGRPILLPALSVSHLKPCRGPEKKRFRRDGN